MVRLLKTCRIWRVQCSCDAYLEYETKEVVYDDNCDPQIKCPDCGFLVDVDIKNDSEYGFIS